MIRFAAVCTIPPFAFLACSSGATSSESKVASDPSATDSSEVAPLIDAVTRGGLDGMLLTYRVADGYGQTTTAHAQVSVLAQLVTGCV